MNAQVGGVTSTRTIPDKVTWTSEDQRVAFGRGWGLFEAGGPNELELQRYRESGLFNTDAEALVTVLRRTHNHAEGSLERKALNVLRQDNPEYFEEVVLDAARRLRL